MTICRALAKRGVASVLPDLPGQGESLVPLSTLMPTDLQVAFDALIQHLRKTRPVFSVGLRSGVLFDKLSVVDGRWHFAPQNGGELWKALSRIKQVAVGPSMQLGDYWYLDDVVRPPDVPEPPVEIAGNIISPVMLSGLEMDGPLGRWDGFPPLRTVRLDTDPTPADLHVPGTPLWRRAEPDNDPALADLLADDIADWIAACEG